MATTLGRKATEAVAAAAHHVTNVFGIVNNKNKGDNAANTNNTSGVGDGVNSRSSSKRSKKGSTTNTNTANNSGTTNATTTGGGDNASSTSGGAPTTTRCAEVQSASFSFFDNMCGPMLRTFHGDAVLGDDTEDLVDNNGRGSNTRGGGGGTSNNGGGGRNNSSSRRTTGGEQQHHHGGGENGGRGGGGSNSRRPTGSYDYDDETNATDVTGSYDDDDETSYDESNKKGGYYTSRVRGRDRKPRPQQTLDSPSEVTSVGEYSEFDDDTMTDMDSKTTKTTITTKATKSSFASSSKKSNSNTTIEDVSTAANSSSKDMSEKLITQPLASGFAKRCYFTKAGIGRTTQHYEGLTLTGNTVLMLAAAMKLKGCPTICDEDLRRVENTYPNQFSRLPDELLLSSGWRRISKYCHFSHKPLPDGVPFFHSRKRCHPNGGFYFLLCSAVGMTRLMDVEPLNRDALAVLQTDFPITCEKAPAFLMEEPSEWTLVNKFCFFSGGPINVEEDVYYRVELGGTEIYMLAFLSPSLSPEELYRLNESGGGMTGDGSEAGPLRTVAEVEEVESVYDLTERDFDDLKLYHLGPCRALPLYLLHPHSWTKVLPPHFLLARDEALRIAQDFESRYPSSIAGSSIAAPLSSIQGRSPGRSAMGESAGSGYVELGRGLPSPYPSGPVYPPQNGGLHQEQQQIGMHPNAQYYQQPMMGVDPRVGYPPMQQQQYGVPSPIDCDMNYYFSSQPHGVLSPGIPPAHYQQLHMPPINSPHRPHMNGGYPYDVGQYPPYGNGPPVQWRDVQEEGAFSRLGGGDQPDDEAIATIGGGYGVMPNSGGSGGGPQLVNGIMNNQMLDPNMDDHYQNHQAALLVDSVPGTGNNDDTTTISTSEQRYDGEKSVMSQKSSLMGGAQNRLRQKRMNKGVGIPQRPDLSTKLGQSLTKKTDPPRLLPPNGSWEDETSMGTSAVSAGSSMYTDISDPTTERSSRRALILQMAKARMKNVKETPAEEEKDDCQDESRSDAVSLTVDEHMELD